MVEDEKEQEAIKKANIILDFFFTVEIRNYSFCYM